MSSIPSGHGEVTQAWINSVTGWSVDSVELTDIGTGIGISSSVYRAVLVGDGCPASVVIKLTATDPAAAYTSTVLSMYRREVKFFELLAQQSPMRVPACHYAEVSDNGDAVVVIMEDLGGNRMCDQIAGMAMEDAERCIDGIADWHAQWWRQVDGLEEQNAAVALGSPMYPAMLPGLFAQGWDKLLASAQCVPPDNLLEIGQRFGELIPGLLQQLNEHPLTLLHGDLRADNIMFDREGAPIVIDFQLIGTGSAAYDLAYFITQSIDADIASEHETALRERWRQRILAKGIPAEDLQRIDADYAAAALFCLVYPVIGARGVDLDDARQGGLVNTMMFAPGACRG